MMFNKELFEKKITILDQTIDKIFDKTGIPTDFTGNIAIVSFNTPKVAARARKRFPKAKVCFIEESALKGLFGICGLYYNDEGDLIKMLKNLEQDGLYIIANLPYGIIGANITKKIIDTVEFIEYINLEPAVDFITNKKAISVINYIKSIGTVPGFGGDAHVLPSIFIISKNKCNNDSLNDYLVRIITIQKLKKYFSQNLQRNDVTTFSEDTLDLTKTFDTRLIFGVKISADAKNHSNGCNVGGTCKSSPYKFNHELLSLAEYYSSKNSKGFWGCFVEFKTIVEKTNALNFVYSKDGFRFCNMLTTSMNRDNFHSKEHAMWFPKVDWSRPWTVEEILTDYGYTEDEIKAVMEDLKNFKGMDD